MTGGRGAEVPPPHLSTRRPPRRSLVACRTPAPATLSGRGACKAGGGWRTVRTGELGPGSRHWGRCHPRAELHRQARQALPRDARRWHLHHPASPPTLPGLPLALTGRTVPRRGRPEPEHRDRDDIRQQSRCRSQNASAHGRPGATQAHSPPCPSGAGHLPRVLASAPPSAAG